MTGLVLFSYSLFILLIKVCGKKLSCGHHTCRSVCHSGDCGDCPRGGPRTCPCTKTTHTLSCTADVPTCGDTCGKVRRHVTLV